MKTIKIEGMSCGHCERRTKNALEEIDGVHVLKISASEKLAEVDADGISNALLIEAVKEAGYTVVEILE